MERVDIHADMMTLQAALRAEDFDALFRQDAETDEWFDDEYDAWLDVFLADAQEAWLDDIEEDELVVEWEAAAYIPFQQPAAVYVDPRYLGPMTEEPGYYESLYPDLF